LGRAQGELVFLSSRNITEFLSFKHSTAKYLLNTKFDFKQISIHERPFCITQSQRNRNIFRLEAHLPLPARQAQLNFVRNFGNRRNKLVIAREVLESFAGRYTAVYEKYLFTNQIKLHELITIHEDTPFDGEDTMFVKGVDVLLSKNFLEYL
jgi:hypothetical protein